MLAQWGYYDYRTLGAGKSARAFQILCKLDGNGDQMFEEFHYDGATYFNQGVKLGSKYEPPTTSGAPTFQITQTDTYGYDNQLDYLTGAVYGDALANSAPSWYDAHGNMISTLTSSGTGYATAALRAFDAWGNG